MCRFCMCTISSLAVCDMMSMNVYNILFVDIRTRLHIDIHVHTYTCLVNQSKVHVTIMYTVTRVAGDSAHQWLPVGGLGMNTGIDDAFSLTWKLAAVLKGYGGPYLLHSYEVERKPACDAILRYVLLLAITVGIGSRSKSLTFLASNPLIRFILRKLLAHIAIPQITSGQKARV